MLRQEGPVAGLEGLRRPTSAGSDSKDRHSTDRSPWSITKACYSQQALKMMSSEEVVKSMLRSLVGSKAHPLTRYREGGAFEDSTAGKEWQGNSS